MEENNELINNPAVEYTDDNIRHLSDMEHVRTRPGMYIGKLGDGSHAEDGINWTFLLILLYITNVFRNIMMS